MATNESVPGRRLNNHETERRNGVRPTGITIFSAVINYRYTRGCFDFILAVSGGTNGVTIWTVTRRKFVGVKNAVTNTTINKQTVGDSS